mmetsp:Transcript_10040/g.34990  ORF Transcript_10040/g.34990 Transcript_10040/m.34990 type:complete len:370 (+) Transcript_10040:217-1326(+)
MGKCQSKPGVKGEEGDAALVSLEAVAKEYGASIEHLVSWAKSGTPEQKAKSAQALARLAEQDEHQVLLVSKAGVLTPLVGLLHSEDSMIRSAAIAALANLALHESNQDTIVKEVGAARVVQLARGAGTAPGAAPDEGHGRVRLHAAGAIANLAYNNPRAEKALLDAGAAEALSECVRSPDEALAAEAGAALANLARNPASHQRLLSGGAAEALHGLLARGREGQTQAARALHNLALGEAGASGAALRERGVLAAYVGLVQEPDAELARLGVAALEALSADAGTAASLVQDYVGAVEALLLLLKSEVHRHLAVRTVANLCAVKANHPRLTAAGAVGALISLTRLEDVEVHAAAQVALTAIAESGGLSRSC